MSDPEIAGILPFWFDCFPAKGESAPNRLSHMEVPGTNRVTPKWLALANGNKD